MARILLTVLAALVAVHFTRSSATTSIITSYLTSNSGAPSMAESFQLLLSGLVDSSYLFGAYFLEDVSEDCMKHLLAWSQNLSSIWSLQMLDAMSKIPEGMLSGHTTSLGDFDECLAVRADLNLTDGTQSNFKGQYCGVKLEAPEKCSQPGAGQSPLAPMFAMGIFPGGAVCVPNSCSAHHDLKNILATTSNLTGICITLGDCQADDKPQLQSGDIVMITILSVVAALCVLGTCVDVILTNYVKVGQEHVNKPSQILIAFSFYTNTKKWLNTSGGSDNLGCIHGIRFLSTCWVVLAHTWATWIFKSWNLMDMVVLYKDWTIYPILNGTISVDTFFTLAGLLTAYNIFKVLDKTKGHLNIPMMYLHRYVRLTPVYAILIGIMATWFQYLRRGPNTVDFEHIANSCKMNWWHNLLYVNNLITYSDNPDEGQCHGESWYLGNDMQFFLISPLLLWPLWKWRKVGTAILGGCTLASVVVPFVVTYVYELYPTMLISTDFKRIQAFANMSYTKPWMRFGPYIVGLWAGYLLYLIRKPRRTRFRLPRLVVALGWATSTGVALAIIFGPMSFFDPEVPYNRLSSAFYASLHRFAWGSVISWIVFACTMGYGGPINTFLSWKVFAPLGRLSFCVYLISFWLQMLFYSSARQHMTYDLYTAINHFFMHMVMSLLVSFVVCMAFESPFIALEKIVFGEGKGTNPSRPSLLSKPTLNGDNVIGIRTITEEADENEESPVRNGNHVASF